MVKSPAPEASPTALGSQQPRELAGSPASAARASPRARVARAATLGGSPSSNADTIASAVVTKERKSNLGGRFRGEMERRRLSPHSGNVQATEGRKVHFDTSHEETDGKWAKHLRSNQENDIRPGFERLKDGDSRKTAAGLSLLPVQSRMGSGGGGVAVRKRSYSFSEGHIKHPPVLPNKRWRPGGGRVRPAGPLTGSKNVLPSKFLLGGNIHDPLNLNSLSDERVARLVNAVTPESSPLPTPQHRKEEYKIEVLIPPNISDPLNLNAENDSDYEAKLVSPLIKKKKFRHRKRPRRPIPRVDVLALPGPLPVHAPGNADIKESGGAELKTVVTGQTTESVIQVTTVESGGKYAVETVIHTTAEVLTKKVAMEATGVGDAPGIGGGGSSSSRPKVVRTEPTGAGKQPKAKQQKHKLPKFNEKNEKFQHGNYNQYYGYRNPGHQEDPRIPYLKEDWFRGKQVLDIGCNIGHMTITLGRKYHPQRIVGLDIDKELVEIAKKNIRHYMNTKPAGGVQYPRCMGRQFGPLNPLGLDGETGAPLKGFPHNVEFYAGNYVLECDQLLETIQPEFDTIMCLSTTKWMHLNNGDEGLKRAFRRMYNQLKPDGILILECQPFSTYGKRKKLTEKIFNNFEAIKLRPEHFPDFLLHEVGFARCETIAIPSHSSKGFQRPLQVFSKTTASGDVSASTTPCSFGISPHSYNPSFTPCYGKFTPVYNPRYNQSVTSGDAVKSPSGGRGGAQPGAFLYPGPSHLYSGPTPGVYSTSSTPSGLTPGYTGNTPGYPPGGYSANSTPSHMTPGYAGFPSNTPVYTGPSSAFSTPHNTLSSPAYPPTGSEEEPLRGSNTAMNRDTVSSSFATAETVATATSAAAVITASPSPPTPRSASSPEGFTPGYTPRYTPSYTPLHQPPSQSATPLYSASSPAPSPLYSPGNATPMATYSPAHYDPADVQETAAGYSPSGGPAYSPSAPYYSPAQSPGYSPSSNAVASSPAAHQQNYYSPHTPSYSPTQGGGGPACGSSAHSPSGPLYSPGNATPAASHVSNDSPPPAASVTPAEVATPGYSPSIQGSEVSGNTTPHPGVSDSPLNSPGPRYSWAGGSQPNASPGMLQASAAGGSGLDGGQSPASQSLEPSSDGGNVVMQALAVAEEDSVAVSPEPASGPASPS